MEKRGSAFHLQCTFNLSAPLPMKPWFGHEKKWKRVEHKKESIFVVAIFLQPEKFFENLS